MQFDPGLEYKPSQTRAGAANAQNTGGSVGINTGTGIVSGITNRQTNNQSSGVGGGGSNKDDSWQQQQGLLLCSALTDGPYSYIWTQLTNSFLYNVEQLKKTLQNKIRKPVPIKYKRQIL